MNIKESKEGYNNKHHKTSHEIPILRTILTFLEIIYDGDIHLLTIEIEENYDDFEGFSVTICPNCGKWSVCD
ncbi:MULTISPECIES: hypothetical protein [Bacillus]|uniref:Uncharacterized protein n=2 Tax=Bacillus cereus group TaxID=86661 RepID=A0A2B0WWV7_BACAN|nr:MULTISPECIES: hypothetical protein [Bacillus]MCU0097733.1 hypothetical protein [Bacillus sp. OR9]KZD26871.1 hypothetical protein B4082_5542 [Bacillus cereus]MBJ8062040.1 hypothetical protein [Bacillus cereus]MCU4760151.1 hypothetical protein [Bacillus cereus]MCU5109721.1 hypothetical protein [Bacillus cereus]